uniref:Uncharacterized protein n=1 Tax=Octactis speculum TaxID=3111310 RepID=A0A7S2D3D9_9STRA
MDQPLTGLKSEGESLHRITGDGAYLYVLVYTSAFIPYRLGPLYSYVYKYLYNSLANFNFIHLYIIFQLFMVVMYVVAFLLSRRATDGGKNMHLEAVLLYWILMTGDLFGGLVFLDTSLEDWDFWLCLVSEFIVLVTRGNLWPCLEPIILIFGGDFNGLGDNALQYDTKSKRTSSKNEGQTNHNQDEIRVTQMSLYQMKDAFDDVSTESRMEQLSTTSELTSGLVLLSILSVEVLGENFDTDLAGAPSITSNMDVRERYMAFYVYLLVLTVNIVGIYIRRNINRRKNTKKLIHACFQDQLREGIAGKLNLYDACYTLEILGVSEAKETFAQAVKILKLEIEQQEEERPSWSLPNIQVTLKELIMVMKTSKNTHGESTYDVFVRRGLSIGQVTVRISSAVFWRHHLVYLTAVSVGIIVLVIDSVSVHLQSEPN